jgi:hypothetical protein
MADMAGTANATATNLQRTPSKRKITGHITRPVICCLLLAALIERDGTRPDADRDRPALRALAKVARCARRRPRVIAHPGRAIFASAGDGWTLLAIGSPAFAFPAPVFAFPAAAGSLPVQVAGSFPAQVSQLPAQVVGSPTCPWPTCPRPGRAPVVLLSSAGFALVHAPIVPELAFSSACIATEPRITVPTTNMAVTMRARRCARQSSGPSNDTRKGLSFITHALNTKFS